MRRQLGFDMQGPEFDFQASQVFTSIPRQRGGCEYYLEIRVQSSPSSQRADVQFAGRAEVQNVVIELVTHGGEVIRVIRPKRPQSRLSLNVADLNSIDVTELYYAASGSIVQNPTRWHVYCPVGLSLQLYRYPVAWESSILSKYN